MTAVEGDYRRPGDWPVGALIDTDVHVGVPTWQDLRPYLDQRWRDYVGESGMSMPESNLYPPHAPNTYLDGSWPQQGTPGSSLELTSAQLLDPWQTEIAILNCACAIDGLHNDDLAAALATAVNRWQLECWLQRDRRLRGSAVLPVQNPQLAAEEVERIADHPEFVQVLVPARTREPLGRRGFWPIYQAAQRHDLVVGVQAGGISGMPLTSVGWPSSFLEDYVDLAGVFQSQVLSLVSEGVFAQFPRLRVAMIESGFTWLPSLMWRFDKNWKGLRREVPWVKQAPSEVIRDRFRFTLQPMDRPPEPGYLIDIIEQIDCDEMLMFSTDYPHAQFEDPATALPRGVPDERLLKIMSGNARATYRL